MENSTKTPPQVTIDGLTINADLSAPGPYLFDGCDTLPKLFLKRCNELGERVAHREKDYGIWLSYSWRDFYQNVRLIALGLRKLGLTRGDVVSILSEDNKEWIYFDQAIQGMGCITAGIYATDSASQLSYIINDSQSKFLIIENDEQLDKYLSNEDNMKNLKNVIILDDDGLQGFKHEKVLFLKDLYDLGRVQLKETPELFEAEIALGASDDDAILVYTSGTTGAPKGAIISQNNIMFSLSSSVDSLPLLATDEQVCFLPLCHILERLVSGFSPIAFRSTVNFSESPETVFECIQEVSPHVFTAVPRVWEKIYSRITILANDSTKIGQIAYALAMKTGLKKVECEMEGKPVPFLLVLQYWVFDFLVFQNLKRMIGLSRIRRATTGAAPTSPDLIKWYRAIGIELLEGYGMTESSGVISVNLRDNNKIGTVGQAIDGSAVRIADDGEIQYKAGNVFKGYWRKPEKTAETFTSDGWLKTGDVGYLDNQGYLNITGRIKDIIITAGGKNITPAEIENKLKFSAYISDAVVIGDRRKFLTCLIMIDQENVEKFAQDNRVPFSDFASLCARVEVQELIRNVIGGVNKDFARVEQIKDFRLIDVLLTAEDDELTATMKLKRGFVEKKHATLIDDMY